MIYDYIPKVKINVLMIITLLALKKPYI